MSHAVYISEEHYAQLETLANMRGQTLEEALADLLHDILPNQHDSNEQHDDSDDELPELSDEELENSPLFQVAGIYTGPVEPGWLDRHDEVIAEEALDPHTEED